MSEELTELDADDQSEILSDESILESQPLNTDLANADMFVKRYAESFRFVTQWDRWLAWDSTRWVLDGAEDRARDKAGFSARQSYTETLNRMRFLEEGLKAALAQRGGKCDETDRLAERIERLKKICGWYITAQNSARITATVREARPKMHVAMSRLDGDPSLFNVANGTIDLRTGELHKHNREQFLTQLSPVAWDDSAKCPTWDRFIHETMQGDIELVLYLQRVVGYCMTASIKEHALFFLHGDGGNGKSTFARSIQVLMGEYSAPAPRGLLFEAKTQNVHPTELAGLYGLRFVVCAEVGEQSVFDEAKVKDLTGGDPLRVRRMNEDFWTLGPTHKLLMFGQHKPIVRGDDKGIWRRIRLIPWQFTTATPDTDLPEKLSRELPGILRWAVNGALEWHRLGLAEPDSVLQATLDYRAESNVIGEFLLTVTRGEDQQCTAGELRAHYERWCKECGHQPLGGRMLGARLRREGFSPKVVRVGLETQRVWAGFSVPVRREREQY